MCNFVLLKMLSVNHQYIMDNSGKKISVVIPLKDFKSIMEVR